MSKGIFITLAISSGLFFSSCKNSNSENNQSTEIKTELEATIPVGTKKVEDDKKGVDDELADKIKNYIITEFLTDADNRAITEDQRKFQLYKVDLNNDGNEEIFVNFMTSYFCGSGGCTVLLLDNNLKLITRFSPTQTLFVDEKVENDWRILLTNTEGSWRKLIYENGTYPSNPTMVDATNEEPSEKAVKMFDEDHSKQKTYNF